jgi:peptide-methionine (S)-S-oxide reductase
MILWRFPAMTHPTLKGALIMLMLGLGAFACERPTHGKDLPQPKEDLTASEGETSRTAVLAAGCFWCVEAVFEQLDGVTDVVSGYAGDSEKNAKYDAVSAGATRHAEAVQITYDPRKITYGQLLRVFFATHDPTTKDRQGPDWGHQYRSAIFFANDDEKRVAEAYIRQLADEQVYAPKQVVTTLEPLTQFYPAEQYHQDFVDRNPGNPYVRQWVPGKIEKLHTVAPDRIKRPTTQPADR